MSDGDEAAIRELTSGWLDSARGDLAAARHLLEEDDFFIYRIPAFHAQQAVEKVIKALLTRLQIDFPRTHDVQRLQRLLPPSVSRLGSLTGLDVLSGYAVDSRYPDQMPEHVTEDEARHAVALAEEAWKAAVTDLLELGIDVTNRAVRGE